MDGVPRLSPALALGFDIGTTNTKAALVQIGEPVQVRATAVAPTPPPADVGETLAELARHVLGGGRAPGAVGIASMAETGVPLDSAGLPLADWLRWDGRRAGTEADDLADRLGWHPLVAATGVRPSPKVPLVTWTWLRRNRPAMHAAMARWAGAADLACLRLSGRLATDHTLAGRTMAYRLPEPGRPPATEFDRDLLAEAGLVPQQLPAVVPDGVAGHVSDPEAVAAGMLPGTPVAVAGHDHAVGAYAAGVRAAGQAADSVGTAEAVLAPCSPAVDRVAAARSGMSAVLTVDGTTRAVLAGAPAAGAAVRWWLEHEGRDMAADDLFAAVLALGDDPGDAFVLPYLTGRQAPAPDPTAHLRVVGPDADPVRRARALLLGLCLQARWILAEQARLIGESPAELTVLGGPIVGNPAWLRLKALSSPTPLRVVPEPEAVAAGAALIGAVRAGLADPATAVLDRVDAPCAPRRDYDALYERFVAAAMEGGP